jgi:hypothetical protein
MERGPISSVSHLFADGDPRYAAIHFFRLRTPLASSATRFLISATGIGLLRGRWMVPLDVEEIFHFFLERFNHGIGREQAAVIGKDGALLPW